MIAYLVYMTVNILAEVGESRKFILKSYLANNQEAKSNNTFAIKYIPGGWGIQKYLLSVQNLLDKTGANVNVRTFMFKRIAISLASGLGMVVLYLVTGVSIYLFASVAVTVIFYQMPLRSVKTQINSRSLRLQVELPEYLSSFSLLLQTYTPYESTKKSIDYTGPLLKPYVEKLVTDIDLYPSSDKPYFDFADAIDSPEAKSFMIALRQSMRVNAKEANESIQEQMDSVDKLMEEAYEELGKNTVSKFLKYDRMLILPLLIIIGTFIVLGVLQAFQDM